MLAIECGFDGEKTWFPFLPLSGLYGIFPIFQGRIDHSQDVLGGYAVLDVMNLREHESAARCEYTDPLLHLLPYFVDGSMRKHGLGFNAAAPEHDPSTEQFFQLRRIHPRGGRLYGVQNINARLNEMLHQSKIAPTAMIHRFRVAVLMYAVGYHADVGDI